MNVLRVSLHPEGVAPRIVNLAEWRAHLLDRLGRRAVSTGDPALAALFEELSALPGGKRHEPYDLAAGAIAVPLRLRAGEAELAFISTMTTFWQARQWLDDALRASSSPAQGDRYMGDHVRVVWGTAGGASGTPRSGGDRRGRPARRALRTTPQSTPTREAARLRFSRVARQ